MVPLQTEKYGSTGPFTRNATRVERIDFLRNSPRGIGQTAVVQSPLCESRENVSDQIDLAMRFFTTARLTFAHAPSLASRVSIAAISFFHIHSLVAPRSRTECFFRVRPIAPKVRV